MSKTKASLTIALAVQPDVGKSTVFNLIMGLNQHVRNWLRKTIEPKQGNFTYHETSRLMNLPGTYSLTATRRGY
ncbi:MAG: FeoB small GTPase domain-containing protein [Anaerolineales bacterium]